MKDTAATDDTPAHAYGRLLLRLHDLIAKGQGDSPEADAVRDRMDGPWHALTEAEQELLGGLSEDLYALAEGNPRSVRMSAEERRQWGQEFRTAFEAGAWDRALVLLRRPPDDVPVSSPIDAAPAPFINSKTQSSNVSPFPATTTPSRCAGFAARQK